MNPFPLIVAGIRRSLWVGMGVLILLSGAIGAGVGVSLIDRAIRNGGAVSAEHFDLIVGPAGSDTQLVFSTVFLQTFETPGLIAYDVFEELSADARVAGAAPLAFADSWSGMPIVGTEVEIFGLLDFEAPRNGRWFSEPFEAIVGAGVPFEPGDSFISAHGMEEPVSSGDSGSPRTSTETTDAHGHDRPYIVVGKLPPTGTPWDRAIVTDIRSIWEIHEEDIENNAAGHEVADAGGPEEAAAEEHEEIEGREHEEGAISAVLVKPRTIADAYTLRSSFRTSETTAVFPGEILVALFGALDSVKSFFTLLTTVINGLVGAALILALMIGLGQKRKSIAVLRALGAGRGYVFLVVWVESALVFAVAILAGFFAGLAGAGLFAGWFESVLGVKLSIEPGMDEVVRGMLSMAAGLAGALVPAFSAYRQPAAVGLKSA